MLAGCSGLSLGPTERMRGPRHVMLGETTLDCQTAKIEKYKISMNGHLPRGFFGCAGG